MRLIAELKLKKAIPEDLKDVISGVVKLKTNFSIYLLDPKGKYISGPILLSLSMNLERLSEYLEKGLIYIPEYFYKDIPMIIEDFSEDNESENIN